MRRYAKNLIKYLRGVAARGVSSLPRKKYLQRKTKPKAEFYEKRGR